MTSHNLKMAAVLTAGLLIANPALAQEAVETAVPEAAEVTANATGEEMPVSQAVEAAEEALDAFEEELVDDQSLPQAADTEGENTQEAEPLRSRIIMDKSRPLKLVEFDGGQDVLSTARRQRVIRASLGYTLQVGADGAPTACKLTEGFRRSFTEIELCRELMSHHTFQPARDANGMAVASRYTNRLYYRKLRDEE
jgi:hypothetical protein